MGERRGGSGERPGSGLENVIEAHHGLSGEGAGSGKRRDSSRCLCRLLLDKSSGETAHVFGVRKASQVPGATQPPCLLYLGPYYGKVGVINPSRKTKNLGSAGLKGA